MFFLSEHQGNIIFYDIYLIYMCIYTYVKLKCKNNSNSDFSYGTYNFSVEVVIYILSYFC